MKILITSILLLSSILVYSNTDYRIETSDIANFWKAYERFRDPKPIKEGIMFVVATIGLLANLISVFLLRKDSKHNLNIRAAYLHLFGDTLSSVALFSSLFTLFSIFFSRSIPICANTENVICCSFQLFLYR